MSLIVGTWYWGTKYSADYIDKLDAGVRRHLAQNYRWMVWHPEPADEPLITRSGCFVRLRMFDPAWQARNGIATGDRVVCLDLDAVVTGPLDLLFDRHPDTFVILKGANSQNPCPFNGSIFMLRAGSHADVWSEFSFDAIKAMPYFKFPDDQGWFHWRMPNSAVWPVGPLSGIYAFQKPKWPKGNGLPADAKLVVFPGWRDPAKFADRIPWIKQHWRM